MLTAKRMSFAQTGRYALPALVTAASVSALVIGCAIAAQGTLGAPEGGSITMVVSQRCLTS